MHPRPIEYDSNWFGYRNYGNANNKFGIVANELIQSNSALFMKQHKHLQIIRRM